MSVQALSWVLEHSKSRDATRCVLVSIANHVGPKGDGWVYVEQVLKEANCSLPTYHRSVQWAIKNGELVRECNKGSATKAAPNRRPNLFAFVALGSSDCGVVNMMTPSDCVPHDSQSDDPKPRFTGTQIDDPEPLVKQEPSKEPLENTLGFDDFYAAYPRHVARGDAEKAWKEATKKTDPAVIVAAARAFAERRQDEDPKFTAYPATWLRAQRWLDEPDPPQPFGSESWRNIDRVFEQFDPPDRPAFDAQGRLA